MACDESTIEYTLRIWHRDGRVQDTTFRADSMEQAIAKVTRAFDPVRVQFVKTQKYACNCS